MATNIFLEVNLFQLVLKVSKNPFFQTLEFQRCRLHQKGLQLVYTSATNRSRLTEVNASTVETMQHFHKIVDVHGSSS